MRAKGEVGRRTDARGAWGQNPEKYWATGLQDSLPVLTLSCRGPWAAYDIFMSQSALNKFSGVDEYFCRSEE